MFFFNLIPFWFVLGTTGSSQATIIRHSHFLLTAICRISPFVSSAVRVRYVIKVQETGEPLWRPDGLYIQRGPDELDRSVAITNSGTPESAFEDYTGKFIASMKKTYTSVTRRGDRWFATGDIFVLLLQRSSKGHVPVEGWKVRGWKC